MAIILIADDDEIVVEIVREALTLRGHFVGAVDDGLTVIDIVEAKRPDLVILDCNMPEISGIEALQQIRASNECFATPVVILTGRQGASDEWVAKRSGANVYLRKPFDVDELVFRVEMLIEQAEAARLRRTPPPGFLGPVPTGQGWGRR